MYVSDFQFQRLVSFWDSATFHVSVSEYSVHDRVKSVRPFHGSVAVQYKIESSFIFTLASWVSWSTFSMISLYT